MKMENGYIINQYPGRPTLRFRILTCHQETSTYINILHIIYIVITIGANRSSWICIQLAIFKSKTLNQAAITARDVPSWSPGEKNMSPLNWGWIGPLPNGLFLMAYKWGWSDHHLAYKWGWSDHHLQVLECTLQVVNGCWTGSPKRWM